MRGMNYRRRLRCKNFPISLIAILVQRRSVRRWDVETSECLVHGVHPTANLLFA